MINVPFGRTNMISRNSFKRRNLAPLLVCTLLTTTASAQTFNSNSDGSDGALALTAPGTYTLNPDDIATFGRVLDADRDGVYHFTTINIGVGVTLKASAQNVVGPLFMLAQGPVTIAGTLSAAGNKGHDVVTSGATRYPAVPG